MIYEVGSKVWYKGCPGTIVEVYEDATSERAKTDQLYLVSFGEAGSFRLFGSEVEPRK
jgi:hypothetical protein